MDLSFRKDLDSSSEDEIFIGGSHIKPKELKRRIMLGRRTYGTVSFSDDEDTGNVSFKLIETQSEPEIQLLSQYTKADTLSPPKRPPIYQRSNPDLSYRESIVPCAWETKVSDESFVAMEQLISLENIDSHDTSLETEELDTTLDRIEKILNSGPPKLDDSQNVTLRKHVICSDTVAKLGADMRVPCRTPEFVKSASKTPINRALLSSAKSATKLPIFKTPGKPARFQSCVKGDSLKLTPYKRGCDTISAALQNVASPVAYYINNSPHVPFIKVVRPKKPMTACSSIPKLVADVPSARLQDKENVILPSKAYRSARETKLIQLPDQTHLPHNSQVRKMVSALPQPTVMKHERREVGSTPRPLGNKQDDSIANLSLNQADISVCVVKTVAKTETLKPIKELK